MNTDPHRRRSVVATVAIGWRITDPLQLHSELDGRKKDHLSGGVAWIGSVP